MNVIELYIEWGLLQANQRAISPHFTNSGVFQQQPPHSKCRRITYVRIYATMTDVVALMGPDEVCEVPMVIVYVPGT